MMAIIFEFNWKQYVSATTYIKLNEENKKLKERVKELEQCNLNLQTWLDNKEKVNEQLRKDIKWYDKEEDF